MKLKRPSELYWFMHTEADVEIVENGRAAILSQLDKRLYVELAEGPAGARFSVMDAAPLYLPESGWAIQQRRHAQADHTPGARPGCTVVRSHGSFMRKRSHTSSGDGVYSPAGMDHT